MPVTVIQEPERSLLSWSVILSDGHLGAVGVTDDKDRALENLCEDLRKAHIEGARGLLHKVTVNLVRPVYYYDSLLAQAAVDARTGVVAIEEFPPRGAWGNVDALLKALADGLHDSIPPEAISAGLADLESVVKRRRQFDVPVSCSGG